jgi:hypothetical protein
MSFSSRDSEKVSMNAAFPSTLLEREPPQLLDHLKVVVMSELLLRVHLSTFFLFVLLPLLKMEKSELLDLEKEKESSRTKLLIASPRKA